MRLLRAVMSINFFRDTGVELSRPWHSQGGMSHAMLYTYRVRPCACQVCVQQLWQKAGMHMPAMCISASECS